MARDEQREHEIEFNEILKDIGDWGQYQMLLIMLFLIPCYTVFPIFTMPIIFLTSIPMHWCYVPEVANSNLSIDIQRKIISPPGDNKCSMYDVDYAAMAKSNKWEVNISAPTKPCNKGWQFDKTEYDDTAVTKWNLVCKDAHFVPLMLSNMFQGLLIGTPLFSLISHRFGRKAAFLAGAALIAVSDVGSSLVPFFPLVIVLRIVQGMGISTVYTSGYVIILELVDPRLRMRINGISTASWTAGACLIPLLAWLTRSWVYLSAISSCCAALLLLFWRFLPESPSWLITRGRYVEVVQLLSKINIVNGGKYYDTLLMLYKVQIIGDAYKREDHTDHKFCKHPLLRKRLFLVAMCWICAAVPYFGLNMNTRNLIGNQFINFFLAVSVEIPTHFATWLLIVNAGRRFTLLLAFCLAAISLFLPYPLRDHRQFNIIVTILAKAGVSSAYATLYVLGPELFPVPLKSWGIKICFIVGTIAACFSSYVVFLASIYEFLPYSVFCGLAVIAVICASFLPETNQRTHPKTVEEAENFEKDFHPCSSCSRRKKASEETSQETASSQKK